MMPAWTRAELQDIRAMLADGKTSGDVGRKYGLSTNTAAHRIVALGLRPKRAAGGGRLDWSPEQDAIITNGRAAGLNWAAISVALHRAEATCRERGRAIGQAMTRRDPLPEQRPMVVDEAGRTREPLPAGHPATWEMLLAHTPSLQGAEYRV